MKKYIFTLIALSMIFTATARKPNNTRTTWWRRGRPR